jgi:hypothetical protein
MDIERFSKEVKEFEHETTFHLCWNHDRYEGYVILYNELFCFEMIKTDDNWEFVNGDELLVIMFGAY